jgi:putative heme-binding domain-containing protein
MLDIKAIEAITRLLDIENKDIQKRIKVWVDKRFNGGAWDKFGVTEYLQKSGLVTKIKPPVSAGSLMQQPRPRNIPEIKDVLSLQGNVNKGEEISKRCYMCHNFGKQKGFEFGPNLQGWGKTRSREEIARAVLYPNVDLAHGFEGYKIETKNNKTIYGLLSGSGDFITIKSNGNFKQTIAQNNIKSKTKLNSTLMWYPEMLGLTDAQSVADLISYLKSL